MVTVLHHDTDTIGTQRVFKTGDNNLQSHT